MLLKAEWAQTLWKEYLEAWKAHERGEYVDEETGETKVFDRKFLPLFETSSSPENTGAPPPESGN